MNDDRMVWELALAGMLLSACGPNGNARSVTWTKPLEVVSLGSGDCVVVAGGRVRCWGGLDALASQLQSGAVSVASGKGALGYPRCAVTNGGQVACWGCVMPSNVGQYLPPATQPIANVRQVVVGQMRACALHTLGAISCWGAEYRSRSLDYTDSAICQRSPSDRISQQPQFPAASRIAMTMDGRVCALTESGDVFCEGTFRAFTDAFSLALEPDVGLPQPVPERGVRKLAIPRAQDLVAGNGHFCSLGVDGSVTCWDENQYGQSGAPTELCVEYVYGDGCKVAPHRVRLDQRATAVAAGAHHSCAILEDQTVACWGKNANRGLGFASDAVCHPSFRGFCDVVPQSVPGIHGARELALSKSFVQSWVLTNAGEVVVWPEHARDSDPRRAVAVCQNTIDAWPVERLLASEQALIGHRVRVRGVVSGGKLRSSNPRAPVQLMLHGGGLAQSDEAIADGKLMRFYLGEGKPSPLGLWVYDACLISPPAKK